MSIGCYPVVGDIASTREWIIDGENGSLVSADNPLDVSSAILKALNDPHLMEKAGAKNIEIIRERAARPILADGVKSFYEALVDSNLGRRS
jgi:glycosyltransferase involved in cell wall biosynthesis